MPSTKRASGVRSLLRIIGWLTQPKRWPASQQTSEAPSGFNETGTMPLENLTFRSPARIACGPRADCRWFSQPDTRSACPLREYRLLRNRRAGRLDRRLIDVIVRQSQPAPRVLLRNKKAVPMRNITRAPASRPSVHTHQRECPRVELQAALRPPSSRCHPRPSRHPVTFVQRQFSTTEWPVPSIQRVC
jgi:hypothetical protein